MVIAMETLRRESSKIRLQSDQLLYVNDKRYAVHYSDKV